MWRGVVLVAGLASAGIAAAQTAPRVPGKAATLEASARVEAKSMRHDSFPASLATGIRLSTLAPAAKSAVTEAGDEKRLRVGRPRDVATETQAIEGPARLQWIAAPGGGLAARLAITSPGAASLRVGIAARELPGGAELRFTGSAAPKRILGPVPGAEVLERFRANGAFWSPLTEGETQTAEIWIPDGADPARVNLSAGSASHLEVSAAHQFKSAGVGASQSCEQDVACIAPSNQAVAQSARSVAKLAYTENGATYLCTATLINDRDAGSQVPYLYTAAHCIGSQSAAATINTFWFFDAALCGAKSAPGYRQLTKGATLLYANSTSDAALVRLADRAPEGAWFSGWDATELAAGTALVALHHPAGDLKKISLGQALAATSSSTGATYATAAWTVGSTEGGSSGSGIFTLSDGEYFLRGGLRGGSASCSSTGRVDDPANRDYYSRLDAEAATLRTWLGNAVAPFEDYTGMWWNPEEPGWALSIIQDAANRVVATWLTYDAGGQPTWLAIPEGTWRSASTVEGKLHRTTGSPPDRAYDAARHTAAQVGSARIEFDSAESGSFTADLDGVTRVKAIRRYR